MTIITFRNLSTQPIRVTQIDKYSDPNEHKSKFSHMARNITSLVHSGSKVTAIADNIPPSAQQNLDLTISPFETQQTGDIEKSNTDICRVYFESLGAEGKFRVDLYDVDGYRPVVTSLEPDSTIKIYPVWNHHASHLSLLSEAQLNQWMSKLKDDTPLSVLSIPGTHNSVTYRNALPSVRCQAVNVTEQLENGVRFLDIRGQPDVDDGDISLVHGVFPVSLSGSKPLSRLLDHCYKFLDENPSETIIMSLKREGRGETTDQQFSKILADKYITSRWYTLPHVPTLAECRGKMVLVRRFGLDDSVKNLNGEGVGWGIDAENWAYNTQDCTTSSGDIRVQDFCEVLDTENIDKKTEYVCAHLSRAGANSSNIPPVDGSKQPFFVNFLSASNFWSTKCWPEKIAAKLNPAVVDFLSRAHGNKDTECCGIKIDEVGDGQTGIVVCDWVGLDEVWDLTRLIVTMNGRIEMRERA